MSTNREIIGGLYIHIPFCIKKCLYCDFYSITDLSRQNSFLASLKREIQLAGQSPLTFDTLYIGGGTPSVLAAEAIGQIIAAAFMHFYIRPDAEITLEVNPGTVTLSDLKKYRDFGVNRLNIGVQSFHEENLKFLGRSHSQGESLSSLDCARQAGFDNIGMDLIYGLPEQDENNWLNDVKKAVKISPRHLSCYMLTRENGTPLDREVRAGRIRLPAGDSLRKLFGITVDYLTSHNFFHYEVSNFARKTKDGRNSGKSRHNQKYWSFAPYIGMGPSAHSYMDAERYWNHRSVNKYLQDIRQGKLPIAAKEKLSREQMIMEAVYLGFRTTRGIDLADFKHRFGIDFLKIFHETITEFKRDNFLKVTNTHCALTQKGMVLLDSITAAFTNQDMPADG